jgi:hypothetical protein
MEGVAAVARVALLLGLALVPAGCAAPVAPPPTTGATTRAEPSTRLAATSTSGSARVGSFQAEPGDLWIGGRCSGGDLEVHVDPVAVLPIPCQALPGGQFLNQIVMARSTEITVSVAAGPTVTWDVQVRQG